jgi:very-short-patch-repair endonuclease
MRVVSSLEDARAVVRDYALGGVTSSRSPLAGEPNRPSSDLVGGNKLTEYARNMRKAPTPWEQKLWNMLKGERMVRYKFRRQAPIDHYIVDFVNYEKRLIVELDGSQHLDSAYDQKRDAYLRAQGFHVLRFWNNEMDHNPNGVMERIIEVLETTPHRNVQERFDSPAGGEWERVSPPESKIQMISPPFAACHAGVNYYRHLVDALRKEFPQTPFEFTLCCGHDQAIAHDALRCGFTHVCCDCPDAVFAQLQAMAATMGAAVTKHYPILDHSATAAKPS